MCACQRLICFNNCNKYNILFWYILSSVNTLRVSALVCISILIQIAVELSISNNHILGPFWYLFLHTFLKSWKNGIQWKGKIAFNGRGITMSFLMIIPVRFIFLCFCECLRGLSRKFVNCALMDKMQIKYFIIFSIVWFLIMQSTESNFMITGAHQQKCPADCS